MRQRKKRKKAEKDVQILRNLLWRLAAAADRVSCKYGRDENGKLSDWEEWVELRRCIREASSKGHIDPPIPEPLAIDL